MEKKKNKKGKGIVIAIVIIVLLAGGYLVYDSYFQGKTEEVATVKEKKVASISLNDSEIEGVYSLTNETNHKIFNALEESEATYFKIDNEKKDTLEIRQINENDFDEISPIDFNKMKRVVLKGTSKFFNARYDRLPIGIYDVASGETSTLFGKMYFDGGTERALEWVDEPFGEEIGNMFEKYKLVLSCDDVSIKKITVYDTGEKYHGFITGSGEVVGDHYRYYYVIDADVKTKSANGNIADLGVFANEGESKKIEMLMICEVDTALINDIAISKIYFN